MSWTPTVRYWDDLGPARPRSGALAIDARESIRLQLRSRRANTALSRVVARINAAPSRPAPLEEPRVVQSARTRLAGDRLRARLLEVPKGWAPQRDWGTYTGPTRRPDQLPFRSTPIDQPERWGPHTTSYVYFRELRDGEVRAPAALRALVWNARNQRSHTRTEPSCLCERDPDCLATYHAFRISEEDDTPILELVPLEVILRCRVVEKACPAAVHYTLQLDDELIGRNATTSHDTVIAERDRWESAYHRASRAPLVAFHRSHRGLAGDWAHGYRDSGRYTSSRDRLEREYGPDGLVAYEYRRRKEAQKRNAVGAMYLPRQTWIWMTLRQRATQHTALVASLIEELGLSIDEPRVVRRVADLGFREAREALIKRLVAVRGRPAAFQRLAQIRAAL